MASRQRLRDIDIDAVIASYRTGVVVRAICAEQRVGLATLYRILDDHHIERREPGHRARIPDHIRNRVASEFQAGATVRDIARRHGVSTSSVSNIGRSAYRVRTRVRRHPEIVQLVVDWFTGRELTDTEIDVITRAGARTRLHGLAAIDRLDPEIRASVIQALIAHLHDW